MRDESVIERDEGKDILGVSQTTSIPIETLNLTFDRAALPEGWRCVKLGDVCEVVTGSTPPKAESRFYGGTIAWIKPDDLDRAMYVDSSSEYLSDEGAKRARIIPAGSVLVSCIGNIGKTAIAAKPLATNQQINSLIPSEEVDSDYLFFACRFIGSTMRAAASVSLVPIINKSSFSALKIPLPLLPEQKHISTNLKEQMAAVERARAAAEAQLEASKQFINAVLRESLNSPSTEQIALHLCINEVTKGVGESWSDFPVLGATRAGLAPAKEGVGKSPQRYKPVTTGTIFYNPMRILLGSIAMIDEGNDEGITSPDYVVFRCKEGILHPRWFYNWLRSPYGEDFIKSMSRGAVRERMLFKRLAAAEINIPSWQAQLVAAKKLRAVATFRNKISVQLDSINKLPAALLREAFAGKL